MKWFKFGLLVLLLVVFTACSRNIPQPVSPVEGEVGLISDAEIDNALAENAETTETVTLAEGVEIPDGESVDASFESSDGLSAQAVLPNAGGFTAFIRHDPSSTNPWQLWRHDETSDAKTLIYSGKRELQSVGLSLDGTTFVFAMRETTSATSQFDVYRYSTTTKTVQRLTTTSYSEANVSLSANGATVVWEGQTTSGMRTIFRREYSGSSFTDTSLATTVPQVQPSVSGDGRYLTFVQRPSGSYKVIRLDKTNNSLVTVVTSSSVLEHPSVSNDGNKVAYLVKGTPDKVNVKTLSTGTSTTVVSKTSGIEHPFLTANGLFLSYSTPVNSSWKLFTKDLTTNVVRQSVTGVGNEVGGVWQASTMADFNLVVKPTSLSLAQGQSGTAAITLNRQNGFTGGVNLSLLNAPSGVTASFNPTPATGSSSTLQLNVSDAVAPGTYALTVRGSSAGQVRTARLTLTVTAKADYTISSSRSESTLIVQGGSETLNVSVTRSNGFTDAVNFSVEGGPTGLISAFTPASVTGDSTQLQLTAGPELPEGDYVINIYATGGGITRVIAHTVRVKDFSLSLNAAIDEVVVGGGSRGSLAVSIGRSVGFTGPVSFSLEGVPSGVTANFWPYPSNPNNIFTISFQAAPGTPVGNYNAIIRGTVSGVSRTASFRLDVTDFTLSAQPAQLGLVNTGGSERTLVVFNRIGSFFGEANSTFTVENLPAGMTAAVGAGHSSSSGYPYGSRFITFTTGGAVPVGSYPVTVRASVFGTSRTVTVTVNVYEEIPEPDPDPEPCLTITNPGLLPPECP
jgi:Tol biopolymer transport system component